MFTKKSPHSAGSSWAVRWLPVQGAAHPVHALVGFAVNLLHAAIPVGAAPGLIALAVQPLGRLDVALRGPFGIRDAVIVDVVPPRGRLRLDVELFRRSRWARRVLIADAAGAIPAFVEVGGAGRGGKGGRQSQCQRRSIN